MSFPSASAAVLQIFRPSASDISPLEASEASAATTGGAALSTYKKLSSESCSATKECESLTSSIMITRPYRTARMRGEST